jgi:methyl-accepting chemotaxis protein
LLLQFLFTHCFLLQISGEVEAVKDAAEAVADVVEEAATLTEKVSAEVAEQLPEGGRLRPVAELVEHTSKEVAEEAHLAKDIIHKVLSPFLFTSLLAVAFIMKQLPNK